MTHTNVSMLALPKDWTIFVSTPLASISAIRTFLLGLLAVSFAFSMFIIIERETRFVKKNLKKYDTFCRDNRRRKVGAHFITPARLCQGFFEKIRTFLRHLSIKRGKPRFKGFLGIIQLLEMMENPVKPRLKGLCGAA